MFCSNRRGADYFQVIFKLLFILIVVRNVRLGVFLVRFLNANVLPIYICPIICALILSVDSP